MIVAFSKYLVLRQSKLNIKMSIGELKGSYVFYCAILNKHQSGSCILV